MVKKTNSSRLHTIDIILMALFVSLMAICAWISIPTAVPFTLQTFGVFVTCALLGGKRGTMSIIVYIILGAIGIPVFAGFNSGAGTLLGPSGGYILGFILCAATMWGITSLLGDKTLVLILAMVLGLVLCYSFGTAWFMLVYAKKSGAIALGTALSWCVFPFVIPDIIKMALAITLSKRVKKHLPI